MRNNGSLLTYDRAIRGLIITMILFTAWMGSRANCKDQHQKTRCAYWQSKVDAELESPAKSPKVGKMDQQSIFAGIDCLLMMEGNKHSAKFSGATKPYVSQLFKPATADVAALYYISYLYYQKWDHADAVALQDENGEIDKPEALRQAYQSYKKWFEEVKRIGLAKARETNLQPLADTKVHWY